MLNPAPDISDDIAVSVENLSKIYGLWSSPNARLNHGLMHLATKVLPSRSGVAHRLQAKMSQSYQEFHALHDVSFQVKKGESWGVIGVNGSGKSTLLKIISGKLRPSGGRVVVDGSVGLLDYASGLHGEFTGVENIYLKAAIMGMSRRQIDAKYDSIVEFAGIGDFIHQPVKTYSSGMVARLGFAIIAHTENDIIITDEALAVGDAFFVQKCMDFIRGFVKRGTFLFVSHSTGDVVSLCENAVWLEGGRVKAIGKSKEVAEAYLARESMEKSRLYLARTAAVEDEEPQMETPRPAVQDGRELTQPELAELMNARPPQIIRDGRFDSDNRRVYGNEIEIPDLDFSGGFGVGGAVIKDVSLEDMNGARLTWILGGEMVRLRIVVQAERPLHSPIIGFQVRDRLGQSLFADNTYLVTRSAPIAVEKDTFFDAVFEFQMPYLPVGEYAVRAAVAAGEEADNAMLHCFETALVFRSTTAGARHGLVGIPMHRVWIGASEPLGPHSEPQLAASQALTGSAELIIGPQPPISAR